jgi:signal transduction histidine kinase
VDKDQVSRVFSNLVKNGIQAIPSGRKGIIAFHSDCDEDYVYVTVEDNGSGIPESIREKLFHPNFTTKSSGMGMGLAISRKIIEDFGGELWYETEEGEGTRFHVKLPKAREND